MRGASAGLIGLILLLTPVIHAQGNNQKPSLPDLKTITQTDGGGKTSDTPASTGQASKETGKSDAKTTAAAKSSSGDGKPTPSLSSFKVTDAPAISTASSSSTITSGPTSAKSMAPFHLSNLPTIAGVGVPSPQIPDTHAAPFMQKSTLPDGTVFICVGAILALFGAGILLWRALVSMAIRRSVKRAANAQHLADMKSMTTNPVKKRGFYNAVGASSNLSLDRLSAAPTGTSRPPKPFSAGQGATPPKHMSQASLFFSPTAAQNREVNRSSSYLPAGYYPSPSTANQGLHAPANRYSRSGISPPASPSLPPSRGPGGSYDRPMQSRGNDSIYRNSVATLGPNAGVGAGVYNGGAASQSNLSLNVNVPGGTTVPGGRAPSAYLEDLFTEHGNAMNPNAPPPSQPRF